MGHPPVFTLFSDEVDALRAGGPVEVFVLTKMLDDFPVNTPIRGAHVKLDQHIHFQIIEKRAVPGATIGTAILQAVREEG